MKIGIIIYSKTGHTYSVANKLKEELLKSGHSVKVEKLNPKGKMHPGVKNIEFEYSPDIKDYDLVIFGGPVWAFSLCPVLKTYLEKLSTFENKKVICFITMAFPFAWMGGNNAIAKMLKICSSKGMLLLTTAIINWTKKRDEKINNFINTALQVLK